MKIWDVRHGKLKFLRNLATQEEPLQSNRSKTLNIVKILLVHECYLNCISCKTFFRYCNFLIIWLLYIDKSLNTTLHVMIQVTTHS